MAIGLLISTLSKSLRQAVWFLMGVLALQVIMTGLAPPFEGAPGKVLSAFSYFTPSRWAAAGLGADTGIHPMPVDSSPVPPESIPFDDAIWTYDKAHVFTAAVALVIITVVALGAAIWILRKQLLSKR